MKVDEKRNVVWSPTEHQKEFLSAPEREVLFGGALGGAKTDACLILAASQIGNKDHRALFLRRSFPQLRDAIERSYELYRPLGGVFNVQMSTWFFPSGAKVEFGFLDTIADQWRYAGRSFNVLIWDELCEWENDQSYTYLLTRLRTIRGSGLRIMVRASANPLGPGSSWVRKRFNIPGDGSAARCVDPATGYHRRFIPARLSDNPHLSAEEYQRQLQAISPQHRKALIEGRWDSVAGAVFEEFDHCVHVVEPFPIPFSWDIYRSCDDGWRAPAVVLYLAHDRDYSDTVYVIDEIYGAGLTATELAARVLAKDRSLLIDIGGETIENDMPLDGLIDPAAFATTGTPSRGTEMNEQGCRWRPAEKGQGSIIRGLAQIHERLATRPDGTVGLKIFARCKHLIAELPALTVDPNNPEGYDQNCPDHCTDALRYALTRHKTSFARPRVHYVL